MYLFMIMQKDINFEDTIKAIKVIFEVVELVDV